MGGLKNYIKYKVKNKNSKFFFVIDKNSEQHTENIKLNNYDVELIHWNILISENYQGEGYSCSTCRLVIVPEFNQLNLRKIQSIVSENKSYRRKLNYFKGFK